MDIKHVKKEKLYAFLKDFENNPEKWKKMQDKENFIFDEETQLNIINECSSNIFQFINSPTNNVILKAIKANGSNIRYIDNPSEEVKLEAVKLNAPPKMVYRSTVRKNIVIILISVLICF